MDETAKAVADLVRAKQHEADCRSAWFAAKAASDEANAAVKKAAWETANAQSDLNKALDDKVAMPTPQDWERW